MMTSEIRMLASSISRRSTQTDVTTVARGTRKKKAPEAMMVYDVGYLKSLLQSAGFISVKIVFGSWRAPDGSGLPKPPRAGWTDAPPDFQDLVYCEKPHSHRSLRYNRD